MSDASQITIDQIIDIQDLCFKAHALGVILQVERLGMDDTDRLGKMIQEFVEKIYEITEDLEHNNWIQDQQFRTE